MSTLKAIEWCIIYMIYDTYTCVHMIYICTYMMSYTYVWSLHFPNAIIHKDYKGINKYYFTLEHYAFIYILYIYVWIYIGTRVVTQCCVSVCMFIPFLDRITSLHTVPKLCPGLSLFANY